MPVLNERYKAEYMASGIDVLGISQFHTTYSDTAAFMEDNQLAFPNAFDIGAELATAYGVTGVPTYVFLDTENKIAAVSEGANGIDVLDEILSGIDNR